MSDIYKQLIDKDGNNLFPITKASNVLTSDEGSVQGALDQVDGLIEGLNEDIEQIEERIGEIISLPHITASDNGKTIIASNGNWEVHNLVLGADWNAKSNENGYIENKPFYDERELGDIWQVEDLYFDDGRCYPPSNTHFEPLLDTNASYYVEVEGVKIDNLTYDMENDRIGNRLFGLTVQGGKLTSVIDNSGTITDGTHTLMLGIYEGNLVKIDEKYLPDDIRLMNIRDGEGTGAIAEGTNTMANGSNSHAEGVNTIAFGMAAHAEGYFTQASGISAHAEGSNTVAGEMNSHAEGLNTNALADNSHAEGWSTIANHKSQHVFGEYNIADGSKSASQRGNYVEIVGNGTSSSARSNARTLDWSGNETLAGNLILGMGNNAATLTPEKINQIGQADLLNIRDAENGGVEEGNETTASGRYAHAEGNNSVANHASQHVFGEYNVEDPSSADSNSRGNYVEIVGNGTSSSAKSNARTLDWNGNERLAGSLTLGAETGDEIELTPEDLGLIVYYVKRLALSGIAGFSMVDYASLSE